MFNDIIKSDDITRDDLVMLYTINELNNLVDDGILKSKIFEISEESLELIKDFNPNNDELKECVSYLMSSEFENDIMGE